MFSSKKLLSLILVIGLLMLSVPSMALGAIGKTEFASFAVKDGDAQYDGSYVNFGSPFEKFMQKIRVAVPAETDLSSLEISFEADPTSKVWLCDETWEPVQQIQPGDNLNFTLDVFLQVVAANESLMKNYWIKVLKPGSVDTTDLQFNFIMAAGAYGGADEGNQIGQFAPGSKANLQTAINAANLVGANPAASQAEVDAANQALVDAFNSFLDAQVKGDLTALNAAIELAQSRLNNAIEGTEPGQYALGAIADLEDMLSLVELARAFISSDQEEIDEATADLLEAIAAFDAARVPLNLTDLSAAINAAQAKLDGATEGLVPGNHIVGSKATLQTAINAATAVRDNAQATQAEVDAAVQSLNNAISTFDAAIVVVTKTALNQAITNASAKLDAAVEGTNPGNYAGGSKATLQTAIDAATAIKDNGKQPRLKWMRQFKSLTQRLLLLRGE